MSICMRFLGRIFRSHLVSGVFFCFLRQVRIVVVLLGEFVCFFCFLLCVCMCVCVLLMLLLFCTSTASLSLSLSLFFFFFFFFSFCIFMYSSASFLVFVFVSFYICFHPTLHFLPLVTLGVVKDPVIWCICIYLKYLMLCLLLVLLFFSPPSCVFLCLCPRLIIHCFALSETFNEGFSISLFFFPSPFGCRVCACLQQH